MYKLATFFQSRFSVSEPTVETSSFKDLSHPPSIANSLTANSKPQLGYNGYSSIERPTSASRLSKIWTRFGRRTPEDFSIHEDEIISDELSDSKFNESSVSSVGVANKPSRLHHPLRRHTINLLKNEEEDSVSGAYCTDQVALLSNTSTEFVQRPPSTVRSRHRNFLQRKSRPPLISTSSDSNIDWYYPSTPSPVEVEISVEVVTRPAVLPACPISEPGSTWDENSTQNDTKKINPFDLAFAENSTGEIKETLSTRRKNKSRASLPNISTDLATIRPPPKIETFMTRPLTVNTSDGNTPDLGRMSKDNSMIARKSRQRKANSTMQAEALSNSMRKNSFASGTSSRDEDVDADGISNVPSSCSFIWSDVVPDSPVIPSAPPPSPWATNTNEIPDIKESPPVQHNPWASMSSTYPISSPTTVTPQFFGQHIQQYSTAKSASPSPLGMIRKGLSPLGMETALDSPSLDTLPAAPPCTPCTPFPE